MCQVNGPSYSVQCDHCGKSMRNIDDICPHCKHNYNGGTMDEQRLRETAALLIYAELKHGEWMRLTDDEGEALLNSKIEYLRKLEG